MKNKLTMKLTSAIFVAIIFVIAVSMGVFAVCCAPNESGANAADFPVTTEIKLSNDLGQQRLNPGQSFILTVTISSLLANKSSIDWASIDISVGPLTEDKTAFDKDIASKLRVKYANLDEDPDDDTVFKSNLWFNGNTSGYMDMSTDQFKKKDTASAGAVRISIASKDAGGPVGDRAQKCAADDVKLDIEIVVEEEINDVDSITFGFLPTMLNMVVYGEERGAHTLGLMPNTVGWIGANTSTVRLVSTKGKNEGDGKFTSFDIVSDSHKLLATEKDGNNFKFVVDENADDVSLVPFFSAGITALVGLSDGSASFTPSEPISTNREFEVKLDSKFDKIVLQTTDENGEVSTYYIEIWKNGAYLSDLSVKDNALTNAFHPHTYDYEVNLPAATETTVSLTATVFEGMDVGEIIAIDAKSGCEADKSVKSGEAFNVKVGENGGSVVLTVKSKDGTITKDYSVKFNVEQKPIEENTSNNTILYVIIGVLGALVLAGLIFLIIILLKKKKEKEEEQGQA